jgi:hypothetical protein
VLDRANLRFGFGLAMLFHVVNFVCIFSDFFISSSLAAAEASKGQFIPVSRQLKDSKESL